MPLRYSSEVQMVTAVDLIVRVSLACEQAMQKFPVDAWPLFGGWENFLPDRPGPAADGPAPLVVAPEADEVGSDGDSSDSDTEATAVAAAAAPVVFPSTSRFALPTGC